MIVMTVAAIKETTKAEGLIFSTTNVPMARDVNRYLATSKSILPNAVCFCVFMKHYITERRSVEEKGALSGMRFRHMH